MMSCHQTGSIQNPMTQPQIETKFRDCAAQSVKADVACIELLRPRDDAHQRRFAGAVLASDGMDFSALYGECDPIERWDAPEGLGDLLDL